MAIVSTINQLIGNTPLVKLQRILPENSAAIWLKLESRNPSGSVKDRIALAMVQTAEKAGLLRSAGTIVEATCGNTGVALAMLSAIRGYHCILTMPESMSVEKRQLLALYGAELVLTPAAEGIAGAIKAAQAIFTTISGAFLPQQFENPINPEIHRLTTAQEIWSTTGGELDAFVCGVGTGSTISGVADVIKNRKRHIQVIAVEPSDSPVISGGLAGEHNIQGIGVGFIPKNLELNLLDSVEQVTTEQALTMRQRLFREEGLLVGLSSGANVFAALRVAERLGKGKTVVTMIHDTGERYLSVG